MVRMCALALCALIFCVPVAKACAPGCENFKWSLEETLKRLKRDDLPVVRSGATLEEAEASAFVLALTPEDDVAFAHPPERRKEAGHTPLTGGIVRYTPAGAGTYQVTLSGEGWIDLEQGGGLVASADHTGSKTCPSLRKSVRFELENSVVTLQVSGAETDRMRIAIDKVE